MKLTSKRVISRGNLYLVPRYDNNEIWTKKLVSFVLGKVYENNQKIKKKCYFMKLTWKRVISSRNLLFGPTI